MMPITWDGKHYDLDPSELPMRLLGLIEEATGFDLPSLIGQMCRLDSNAVKSVTWVQDLAENPGLDFASYDGPPAKVVWPHLTALKDLVESMGKALTGHGFETGGSPGSPATSASGEPSSTPSPEPSSPPTSGTSPSTSSPIPTTAHPQPGPELVA